jgi:hypothetical protein
MKQLLLTTLAVAGLIACSKPKDAAPAVAINNANVELNYDSTHQFSLTQGSTAVSPSTYTWTSSDVTVGTIAPTGLFTARRIGETTITGISSDKSSTVQSKVVVKPYSTAWIEPVTTFGSNKTSVKSKEKRTLIREQTDGLIYKGESAKVTNVAYIFESDKLTTAGLQLTSTAEMAQEAAVFLLERYTYLGKEDDIYVFTDGKTVHVGLAADDSAGLVAIYVPYASGGRQSYEVVQRLLKSEVGKLRKMN